MRSIMIVLVGLVLMQMQGLAHMDRAKLDSLCTVLNKHQRLLGGMYITKSGKEVFRYTFNEANKFKGIMRIGSITKVFTVVLIMQLVEEGKLSLEDKLSTFYPAIDGADRITIRHLLTHQSGIYSFDNEYTLGDLDSWIYKPQSKEAMLQRFSGYKLQFEPGTKKAYSNTAYSLLGYIVESMTNSTFNEQLQQRICSKIGITNTYHSNTVDTTKNESWSFVKDRGWVEYPSSDLSGSAAGGAGCISSTPQDIAMVYNAIFSGKLLSKHTVERVVSENFAFNKDNLVDEQYGYGHLGSIDAYYCSATYNPADSVCFVFLFNGLSYPFADVFFKTIDIFYNKQTDLPTFTPIVMNADTLKKFESSYKLRNGAIIEMIVQSGNLHFVWKVNGYGDLKLVSLGNNAFYYEDKGLTFKFGYNKDKKVDKVTMYQGKQVIRMEKQE